MKTILVPTDFHKIAANAIDYAAEIAKRSGAALVLFHAFHAPLVASEVPVAVPDLGEIEKDCMALLRKIEKTLHARHGNKLRVKSVVKCGFAVEEISDYASKQHVDLIVMGMQGAGFLSEKLIGSVTTSVIHDSKCPVIVVGEKIKYRPLKKIALACDYQEVDKKTLAPLKVIAELFKSHIYVLNVANGTKSTPPLPVAVGEFLKLEGSLAKVDHTVHGIENDNVVEGINAFAAANNMDMVVMIPRKHSFLTNLIYEPNTKRMAFHSKVPLLALH